MFYQVRYRIIDGEGRRLEVPHHAIDCPFLSEQYEIVPRKNYLGLRKLDLLFKSDTIVNLLCLSSK